MWEPRESATGCTGVIHSYTVGEGQPCSAAKALLVMVLQVRLLLQLPLALQLPPVQLVGGAADFGRRGHCPLAALLPPAGGAQQADLGQRKHNPAGRAGQGRAGRGRAGQGASVGRWGCASAARQA